MSDPVTERPAGATESDSSGKVAAITPEQAKLLPFYHDLRNDIIQPEKVVVSTQYFWSRWAPRLGPTLTALVICLRRHCYYNRATQERRDWCFPEQATLAREIGVETTKTVRAALQHPLIAYFVRREARYVYDVVRAKKVRTSDMYYVAMDDPLVPEDEVLLTVRAAERLLAEGRGAENVSPPVPAESARPKSKKDRQVTPQRNVAPDGQKDVQIEGSTGQFARQNSAVILTPEDVLLRRTSTITREPEPIDPMAGLVQAFGAANATVPTPAQLARLRALCEQFDRPARDGTPPATGADWVLAAIREAVESGSQYVAPRRIARICERWAATGGPGVTADSSEIALSLPAKWLTAGTRTGETPMGAEQRYLGDGTASLQLLSSEPPQLSAEAPPVASFVVFPELGLQSRPFWQTVADEARRRLGNSPDLALLGGSLLLARDGQVLTIGVPGRSVAERAELRLKRVLEDVARSIVSRSVELHFVGYAEWRDSER